MTELKPCPVCGFHNVESEDNDDDSRFWQSFGYSHDGFFIVCPVCGCRSRYLSDTEEEAIQVWNEMCDMKDKYKKDK